MKELSFQVKHTISGTGAVRLETYHGLASTKEEALALLKFIFERKMIRESDGAYRMSKTIEVRVIDGQGLIE